MKIMREFIPDCRNFKSKVMTKWLIRFVQGLSKLRNLQEHFIYLACFILFCISYHRDQKWTEGATMTTTEKLVDKCNYCKCTAVSNRQPVEIIYDRGSHSVRSMVGNSQCSSVLDAL